VRVVGARSPVVAADFGLDRSAALAASSDAPPVQSSQPSRLARSMRSDSVAMAVMERAVHDSRQVDARSASAMYALLGPRLRADPRLQPTLRALGYSDVTASK